MTIKPRFTGVLVTILLLAGGYFYYRSSEQNPTNATVPATRTRGGQLVASIRTDPRSFNRLIARDQQSDIVALLTQARLVRINRATFELQPGLAERWDSSGDGLIHTLHLRQGLAWSDGTPLTADDVVFTLGAVLDERAGSVLVDSLHVAGQPIRFRAVDPATVELSFPSPSGPGLRVLDHIPILPKHKLAAALAAGTFRDAWSTRTPPSEIVGAGPFVIERYEPGQRIVLARNPRFWGRAADGTELPYLDRIVLEVVPEQNAEMLRLQAGTIDMTTAELRAEDFVPARRAEETGVLSVVETGIATDADAFWFRLKAAAWKGDRRFAFVSRPEFRQALSHAVNREEFAQTVFLGEAVPLWGPVTPGNRTWFSPDVPRYPPDIGRAKALLTSIGLEDRDGNGIVEDASGTEARFTVITQSGVGSYEKGTTVLRDAAAAIGVALDIVPMEAATMIERMLASDYEAIYMKLLLTDLDPAGSMDLWLSSGSAHIWDLEQTTPATEWEKRIDTLMLEQAATIDPDRRRDTFLQVQRILGENLPVLYFVAPRLYFAHTRRVLGVVPSVMRPPGLWNAEQLAVTGPSAAR